MSAEKAPPGAPPESSARSEGGGLYAHYVLGVLVVVYLFNFIDRNILSILAEDIKADLGVSDAQMGFLYGTVFAVFYSVFGIPLARFADVWVRRSLISAGLLFWSLMTAFSGLARSFPVLALFRVGVGIGEASASPAAYSMLSDYYPPRRRATVIAIYSSGVYLGGGLGLFIGGWVLDAWNGAFPVGGPFGLKGWHAAFLAVGLPGVLLAALVRTLREPLRGLSEGLPAVRHPAPFKVLREELGAVLPPFTLWSLVRHGASLRLNLLALGGIAAAAFLLVLLTGDLAQWVALGLGVYVTFSWAQSLAGRDRATFRMLFGAKSLIFTLIAFPTISFVAYGVSFWMPPLLMRIHAVDPTEVGLYIGLGSALGGVIGVTCGGLLADRLKLSWASGRLWVGFITVGLSTPLILWLLLTDSLVLAYVLNFIYHIPVAMWVGVPPSTANDLVLPRMRAVAGAYYLLMNTFIGLALGPYFMGKASDLFMASGLDEAAALRLGVGCGLLMFIPTLVCLCLAVKHLPSDERSRLERAKALGEI